MKADPHSAMRTLFNAVYAGRRPDAWYALKRAYVDKAAPMKELGALAAIFVDRLPGRIPRTPKVKQAILTSLREDSGYVITVSRIQRAAGKRCFYKFWS